MSHSQSVPQVENNRRKRNNRKLKNRKLKNRKLQNKQEMNTKKTSQFSPAKNNQGSPRGVGYFQQFPKSFLRPYGEVEKSPAPETVFRRIQPFTCEWLLRPKVALSELSETLAKNVDIIAQKDQQLVTSDAVNKLVSGTKSLRKSLHVLHRDRVSSAKQKDVIDVLKHLFQEDEDLDGLLEEMFHIGGAMFLTATHLIVAKALIQNPDEYAERVQADDTGSDSVFKENGDIESMRDFILSSVFGRKKKKRMSGSRKDLLKQFDSPTKGASKVRVPLRSPPSPDSSKSSSDNEEAEQQPPVESTSKKARKKRRKNNIGLELLAADEEALTNPKSKTKKKQ